MFISLLSVIEINLFQFYSVLMFRTDTELCHTFTSIKFCFVKNSSV